MTPREFKFIHERARQKQCSTGARSFCCKSCMMGPCMLTRHTQKGVCGATQEQIVAKNLLRMVTGGASAHCGHSNHMYDILEKKIPTDYIKNNTSSFLYERWKDLQILPEQTPFKEIADAVYSASFGANADYKDILHRCLRLGIVDGYYGLISATEIEDDTYGKPTIKTGQLNLNCLDPDKVNIAVHGHEPMLAEVLAQELKHHPDCNLVGVCCTGTMLLAKHGIPLAAHFLLQEEVIATGMVEALVVDMQCVIPSVSDLCACFHTSLITTSKLARMEKAIHMPVTNEEDAREIAKEIFALAKANKANRKPTITLDNTETKEVVVGFTEDNIDAEKIAQDITTGAIKGIICVAGCTSPRLNNSGWVEMYKKLSNDYIIFTTGCMAFELGNNGLLDGKHFFHMGSCVNNARVVKAFEKIAMFCDKQICDMPFYISAPMPISEKVLSIGMFFAVLGVNVHFGYPQLVASNEHVASYLTNTLKDKFNCSLFLDDDPETLFIKWNEAD